MDAGFPGSNLDYGLYTVRYDSGHKGMDHYLRFYLKSRNLMGRLTLSTDGIAFVGQATRNPRKFALEWSQVTGARYYSTGWLLKESKVDISTRRYGPITFTSNQADEIAREIERLLAIHKRALKRLSKLEEEQIDARNLDALDPSRFERLAGELLESMGYQVSQTGGPGDQGIDLIGRDAQGDVMAVQCKRYKGKIGASTIRDFFGALVHSKANRGFIITTGEFTEPAKAWAEGKPIRLVDRTTLAEWLDLYRPQTIAPAAGPLPILTLRRMQFILIPAGEFYMGSRDDDTHAHDCEKPYHRVVLPDFYISRFPVTNADYLPFVRDAPVHTPRDWDGGIYATGKADLPVVSVSWLDAMAFCDWLARQSDKDVRLPTTAEWEKAARGTDGRRWPWGNHWGPIGTEGPGCRAGTGGAIAPVGAFSPKEDSPYGCADMSGNVWEWCHSLAWAYPYHPEDGREDVHSAAHRVMRGGPCFLGVAFRRCASFVREAPSQRHAELGFRPVVLPIADYKASE